MVTNLKEGTKTKCQQYWPDTSTKSFGPFDVTITDSQLIADYIIRSFKLSVSVYSVILFAVVHELLLNVLSWLEAHLAASK